MNLLPAQRDYLLSRGYTDEGILLEGILGVNDETNWEGRAIKNCAGCVGWPVYSMSGQPIGLQTREVKEKRYRFHQLPHTEHLPLILGTKQDWDRLWDSGQMILTEGTFDRNAVRLALPDRAVFARMSKGAPNQLRALIKRYVTHLILAFDNDEAGREATEDTEEKLQEIVPTDHLRLPYKDPAIALQKRGLSYVKSTLVRQLGEAR